MTRDAFGHSISFGVTVRVGAKRKDGKYLVRYTFASTGRTIGTIMTREALDAELTEHPDYVVQGYARPAAPL